MSVMVCLIVFGTRIADTLPQRIFADISEAPRAKLSRIRAGRVKVYIVYVIEGDIAPTPITASHNCLLFSRYYTLLCLTLPLLSPTQLDTAIPYNTVAKGYVTLHNVALPLRHFTCRTVPLHRKNLPHPTAHAVLNQTLASQDKALLYLCITPQTALLHPAQI